jgi:hypothetical protein
MTYARKPSLIRTIARTSPGKEVIAHGDAYDYDNINWLGESAIPEAELLGHQINVYRDLIIEEIKKDATAQREAATLAVLGTDDQEQIRTYEEKYLEAVAYTDNAASPIPLINAELAQTSEVRVDLIALIITQYNAAKATLRVMYGNIEGIRRKEMAKVAAFTTIAEMDAYTGPVWS